MTGGTGARWAAVAIVVALSLPVTWTVWAIPSAQPTVASTATARAVVGYALEPPVGLSALVSESRGALGRTETHLRFVTVELPEPALDLFLESARALPGVAYAEADTPVRAFALPNDVLFPLQWGPVAMRVPEAWDGGFGGPEIAVAVLDTGVDALHPDLAPNVCPPGLDVVNGDADASDDNGHGTHVAGIVAAAINNVQGVSGMANACLLAVKVLDDAGVGAASDVATGLRWAVDQGANVVLFSFGGCADCWTGTPLEGAVRYAFDHGVLMLAAAGDHPVCDDLDPFCEECDPADPYCEPPDCYGIAYPARFVEVVAVASLDRPGDAVSEFSNCGSEVELAAPGDEVWSTVPLALNPVGYAPLSGTSMAAAHAAGVAALVAAQNPGVPLEDVRCLLAQRAVDLGPVGRDEASGYGRVDAAAMAADPSCNASPPLAPELTAVSGDGTAILRWSTPFAWGAITDYAIYRGEAADSLGLLATVPRSSTNDYVDASVAVGTTYNYQVRAVNAGGEGAASSVEAVAVASTVDAPFLDDLEAGHGSWSATGLWHLTTDRANSGTRSLYFGRENGPGLGDNTYESGGRVRGTLTSPPIRLAAGPASLQFWQFFDVQGDWAERPIVHVATLDDPGRFVQLYGESGIRRGGGAFALDMSPFAGRIVHVRFFFDTRDGYDNRHEGWYVDDVAVRSEAPPNVPPLVRIYYPFSTGWENNPLVVLGERSDGNGRPRDVVRVEARVDDGPWLQGTMESAGYWHATLGTVSSGMHIVTARAFDGELFSAEYARTVSVDAERPVVTLSSPLAGTVGGCFVRVAGTATDTGGSNLNFLKFVIDTYWEFDVEVFGDVPSGAFETLFDTRYMEPGNHTFGAYVYDRAGNRSPTVQVPVTVDRAACHPRVAFTSPTSDAWLRGTANLQGTAELAPGTHLARVDVYRNDAKLGTAAIDGSSWSLAWDTTQVGDGPQTLEAVGFDAAGIGGSRARVDVMVVNAPPRLETTHREGAVGCSAGAVGAVLTDKCGQRARFSAPLAIGVTAARIEVTWDEAGPMPDDFEDLGVFVSIAGRAWRAHGAEGNRVVLEIADDGGFLTRDRVNVFMEVHASGNLVDAAAMTPFRLDVTWAYLGESLP